MNDKPGFFKNHADALAIVAINLAMMGIMISMWISSNSRIDAMYSILIEFIQKQ